MIYIKNDELKLADKKVIFEKNGVQEEKQVGPEGIEWWNGLADQHDDITIVDIVDLTHAQAELDRLEEVKNFTTNIDEVQEYIETGNIDVLKLADNDKIKNFVLEKENNQLRSEVDQLIIDSLM